MNKFSVTRLNKEQVAEYENRLSQPDRKTVLSVGRKHFVIGDIKSSKSGSVIFDCEAVNERDERGLSRTCVLIMKPVRNPPDSRRPKVLDLFLRDAAGIPRDGEIDDLRRLWGLNFFGIVITHRGNVYIKHGSFGMIQDGDKIRRPTMVPGWHNTDHAPKWWSQKGRRYSPYTKESCIDHPKVVQKRQADEQLIEDFLSSPEGKLGFTP